jgi:AraC family transcriptional regulator
MTISPHVASCQDRRLRRVLQHITADLTKQSTLKQLASIAGLERTYFCRYFRRNIGLSFSMWNRYIRIERAKQLFADTDLSVTAISMAVGYGDVTTFERNFRRCENTSPRDYKQQLRQARRASNITLGAENTTILAEKSVTAAG